MTKIVVDYPYPELVPYKPGPVVRDVPAAEAAKMVSEGKAIYLPKEK